jgi:hypothetical protein
MSDHCPLTSSVRLCAGDDVHLCHVASGVPQHVSAGGDHGAHVSDMVSVTLANVARALQGSRSQALGADACKGAHCLVFLLLSHEPSTCVLCLLQVGSALEAAMPRAGAIIASGMLALHGPTLAAAQVLFGILLFGLPDGPFRAGKSCPGQE